MLSLRCPRCDFPVETRNVGDISICPACASPCLLRERLIQMRPIQFPEAEEVSAWEFIFRLYLHLITPPELQALHSSSPAQAERIRRLKAGVLN
jgi:hypothetical protein